MKVGGLERKSETCDGRIRFGLGRAVQGMEVGIQLKTGARSSRCCNQYETVIVSTFAIDFAIVQFYQCDRFAFVGMTWVEVGIQSIVKKLSSKKAS